MSTEQNTKSWIPLEFYLGTALGFLLASLMLNATSGWASGLYPIPVLVTAIVGFYCGKNRQRTQKQTIASPRYFKYRFSIFFVICLLCALGPYCVMKTYYQVQAAILPVPPGWTQTSVQTTVLGWDNGAGFFIRIEGYGEQEALQFYRQHFEEKGWSDHSDKWVANKIGSKFVYGKTGSYTRIAFGIVDYMYKPGQKRTIYVSYMN